MYLPQVVKSDEILKRKYVNNSIKWTQTVLSYTSNKRQATEIHI